MVVYHYRWYMCPIYVMIQLLILYMLKPLKQYKTILSRYKYQKVFKMQVSLTAFALDHKFG